MIFLTRVVGLLLILPGLLLAENIQSSLPEPLTLEYVVQLADDTEHPRLMLAEARLLEADAELKQALAGYALELDLRLEAARVEPSELATNQDKEDHKAILQLRKPLYDFGQTGDKTEAAEELRQAVDNDRLYVVQQRKIEITRHYFQVLLADLKYAWDNEDMSIAYIRYDQAQDRHALGEISDIELLTSQNNYEEVRHRRYVSESNQYLTRVALAEVINRPGQLSSNLKMPDFRIWRYELPESSLLIEESLQHNPEMKLQSAQVAASYKQLESARKQNRPRLEAGMEYMEYARDTPSREDWRVELNLIIPLFEHEGMQAKIAEARANWLNNRARLLDIQARIRQRVLNLWQQIYLLKTQRQQRRVAMELRELELDRNRAMYEMELKTDLGDAMVAVSEVRYLQAKTEFELALAWMELDLSLGNKLDQDKMQ